MSLSAPVFQQPLFLLLVPLSWLLLVLAYRNLHLHRYWERRLPAAFQQWLVQPAVDNGLPWPWLLAGLACLLGALALAAPAWPTDGSNRQAALPEPVVLVMELTPDMLASDLPPSRLHQVRNKALDILQWQQPGLTGMVVYAGSAHTLMPLGNDPATARNLLQALHPSIMPRNGRDAAAGIRRALELLQRGANGEGRIVLLARELSQAEQQALLPLLRESGVQLDILGVGSLQGAPIPDPEHGHFDTGQPLSRLQEDSLQRFADRIHGRYARMDSHGGDLLHTGFLERDSSGTLQRQLAIHTEDRGYWLLLPLLFSLALLARRGWLLSLAGLMLLLPPVPVAGAGLDSREPVALERILQDPQAALQQLHDPLWLGIAAYHAGNHALAADYFSRSPGALASYNLGNSLMQLGRYREAAAAYRHALELQPELNQARDNLELAERLLQQEQPPETDGLQANQLQSADTPSTTDGSEKTATLQSLDQDFQQGTLESWLQQIPDHPGALLKHRFQRELQQESP